LDVAREAADAGPRLQGACPVPEPILAIEPPAALIAAAGWVLTVGVRFAP
jgi:hypothetical protein